MDIKKVVFDNNAHLLQEQQRGVAPEVLADIGIHPFKIVEKTGQMAVGSEVELNSTARKSKTRRHRSSRQLASDDIANAAATQKPFPYGYADIDDYK